MSEGPAENLRSQSFATYGLFSLDLHFGEGVDVSLVLFELDVKALSPGYDLCVCNLGVRIPSAKRTSVVEMLDVAVVFIHLGDVVSVAPSFRHTDCVVAVGRTMSEWWVNCV